MPSVQKPEKTGRKITGNRIRDPQDRAALLQNARDFHVQWKPFFDAIYGPRTCTGPTCCALRGEVA